MFKVLRLVVLYFLFSGAIVAAKDYSSANIVIPVLHASSGEIHNVSVPPDFTPAEFHGMLVNSDYHMPINTSEKGPTAEGAVENSDAFRRSAKEAADRATMGENNIRQGIGEGAEAGFTVHRDGTVSRVEFQSDASSAGEDHIKQVLQPDDLGALHTHDSRHHATPSSGDIAAAKKVHRVIWVASREGLYSVDPSGKVEQIFKSPTWYKDSQQPHS